MTLVGCAAEPPDRLLVVLAHTATVTVHDTEVVLTAGVALFGRKAIPPDRFRVVLFHTAPSGVHEAKGSPRARIASFSRLPKPGHGNGVVLSHPATVLVPFAQLGLRLSVSQPRPALAEQ